MKKKQDRSAKARGLKLVSFEIEAEKWQVFRIHAIKLKKSCSEIIREMINEEIKGRR